MDDVGLVKSVLDLTCFDVGDGFCDIGGYCSGLGVRHETLGSEYFSETSYDTHHVRCCNYNIVVKPVLVLDLGDKLLCSYEIRTGFKCFLFLLALCENQNLYAFACSVGKNNRTSYLLVCVTSVTSGPDMYFNRLVKFGGCILFNKLNAFCNIVKICAIYKCGLCFIVFSAFHLIYLLWCLRTCKSFHFIFIRRPLRLPGRMSLFLYCYSHAPACSCDHAHGCLKACCIKIRHLCLCYLLKISL